MTRAKVYAKLFGLVFILILLIAMGIGVWLGDHRGYDSPKQQLTCPIGVTGQLAQSMGCIPHPA